MTSSKRYSQANSTDTKIHCHKVNIYLESTKQYKPATGKHVVGLYSSEHAESMCPKIEGVRCPRDFFKGYMPCKA